MKVCGRSDEVESVRGIITPRQRKRKIEETEETAMRANVFVLFFVCFCSFPEKLETPLNCPILVACVFIIFSRIKGYLRSTTRL